MQRCSRLDSRGKADLVCARIDPRSERTMQTRLPAVLLSATLLALGCATQPKDTATPTPTATPEPTKPPAKPIPDGFFTVTPLLVVKGADAAVDFYVKALGATK